MNLKNVRDALPRTKGNLHRVTFLGKLKDEYDYSKFTKGGFSIYARNRAGQKNFPARPAGLHSGRPMPLSFAYAFSYTFRCSSVGLTGAT